MAAMASSWGDGRRATGTCAIASRLAASRRAARRGSNRPSMRVDGRRLGEKVEVPQEQVTGWRRGHRTPLDPRGLFQRQEPVAARDSDGRKVERAGSLIPLAAAEGRACEL